MTTPTSRLAALRSSTAALLRGLALERWTDADVRAPSLLPNWTRGHVLTHVARNADGISRTLSGALRGERVPRYPGGPEGRNADIEAGAELPVAELLADVSESAERLDRLYAAVAEADSWDLECDDRTAAAYVLARWREVEIHRVDVGGAYTADEWPAAFVGYLLPEVVAGVDARTPASLRIEVRPEGSVTTDLGGTVWTCGVGTGGPGGAAGAPTTVTGPDWALLAWLLGRPSAARGALNAAPDLATWL